MNYNNFLFKNSVSINDDFAMYTDIISSYVLEHPVHSDKVYIGFCLEGYAVMEINLVKHKLVKNEFIAMAHNHIIFHHEISEDFRLVMFSYSKSFWGEMLNEIRKYPLYILFKQKFPSVMLQDVEMEQCMDYFNLLWKVMNDTPNESRRDVVKNLLCSFLINIHLYANRGSEKHMPISRKEEMIGSFFSLIFEHYKEAKDVAFYADKLCVTPQYLSVLVKKIVGKTAKECIDHYIILEIKVLLNSSLSIQEISQQLNFPNSSFFGKYFKGHTGETPLNYRKSRLK
ncbi:MAG: helix-turn-helix domain-containing protein [Parabacteroides sp.]|nr:helix-turn-helix domain-containing protein [Parabacteroides sp.]MDD4404821.1 helix-turn-helix domain-containing protein [Parabacteroides sp.]